MFDSDKPIINTSEDLLDRKNFVYELLRAVISYKQSDSLIIGLYGKWGCGKTSILNMFEFELNSYAYSSAERKPLIIKFDPWNFTDQEKLIDQFFSSLYHGLGNETKKDTLNKREKAVKKAVLAADAAAIIPGASSVAGHVAALLKEYADALNSTKNEIDLLEKKNDISSVLSKLKRKIIIIIDDIDRLNNEEIRQIFQLVKSLADFPNTVYVLPFDKEVVIEALKVIQKGDGSEYLEKIIQVPIDIPNIDSTKLYNILFDKLDSSIMDYKKERRNQEYTARVITKCVMPFIGNLRDISRLINIFKFKYDLVKGEVNVADLLAISALQVFEPQVYEWVYKNKNDIAGDPNDYKNYVNLDGQKGNYQEEEKIHFEEEFDRISSAGSKVIIELLSTLFPRYGKRVNLLYQHVDHKELLRTQRVSSLEKFDIYFSLSIENIDISRAELEYIIFNYNYEQIIKNLISLCEKKSVIGFLIELESQIDNIPMERIPIILQSLINISEPVSTIKSKAFFEVDALTYGHMIIVDLIKRYADENERFSVIRAAVINATNDGIPTCAYLLNIMELAQGELAAEGVEQGEQLVDVAHLKEIEAIVIKKIITFSLQNNLLDVNEFRITSFMWESLNEKTYTDYMKMLLREDINIVKFVAHNANEQMSSDRKKVKSFKFNKSDIEKFINIEKASSRINSIMYSEEFAKLDISIKQKAIAFILWNNNALPDSHTIAFSDVERVIDSWKVS